MGDPGRRRAHFLLVQRQAGNMCIHVAVVLLLWSAPKRSGDDHGRSGDDHGSPLQSSKLRHRPSLMRFSGGTKAILGKAHDEAFLLIVSYGISLFVLLLLHYRASIYFGLVIISYLRSGTFFRGGQKNLTSTRVSEAPRCIEHIVVSWTTVLKKRGGKCSRGWRALPALSPSLS